MHRLLPGPLLLVKIYSCLRMCVCVFACRCPLFVLLFALLSSHVFSMTLVPRKRVFNCLEYCPTVFKPVFLAGLMGYILLTF